MFKAKLVMLLMALGFSASASAAFIQYTFNGVQLNDGGNLNGFFIQDTDDKSIAYYNFSLNTTLGVASFNPSGNFSNLTGATTYFAGSGPTNFSAYNDLPEIYRQTINLSFAPTSTDGTYRVFGSYQQGRGFVFVDVAVLQLGTRSITQGFVTEGAVDARFIPWLEQGSADGILKFIPTLLPLPAQVPEPGSIALMLAGVAGLVGCSRRRASRARNSSLS